MDKSTEKQPTNASPKPKKSLKTLFTALKTKAESVAPVGTQQQLIQANENLNNWENKREGETYHNYGNRICAKVTASIFNLAAFIQKIYNVEKQAQINNIALQEQSRNEVRTKIAGIDEELNQENGKISQLQISRQKLKEQLATCKAELDELKEHNGQENRNEKVKLVIGGVILALLTLYLFMFYSSTFYSAFFKDFLSDGSTSIGVHMFDAQAIPASFSAGIGQLVFVLSAPIIFMGLGFALHYFFKEKSSWKILKIAAIIIVTFVFDCILAYSIAEKIYNIGKMSSLEQLPDYTLRMASSDHNVWAVIFCGFIVYIIWGIVFSLTMTAYEELKSNKGEQMTVSVKIENLQSQIKDNELQESNIKTGIASLEAKKQIQIQKLGNRVFFNNGPIRVAINDFYAGWMTMMAALACNADMQSEAQHIYEQNIATLFSENNAEENSGI